MGAAPIRLLALPFSQSEQGVPYGGLRFTAQGLDVAYLTRSTAIFKNVAFQ